MNIRDRVSGLTAAWYDYGQDEVDSGAKADYLETLLIADLEALVAAATAAFHDLTCPQQDQYCDTIPALRKALAKFADEEAKK